MCFEVLHMKLSIEIIFDNLAKSIPAELRGVRKNALHLGRPEYLLEPEQGLLSGHLYVIKGEQLPSRPRIEKGAALICVGGSMQLPYYLERCGVIQLGARTGLPPVFNALTRIFDRYDAWNERLHQILNTSASVKEMVTCSQEIFENPIFVLNANFHYLAHSDYSEVVLAEWEKALGTLGDDTELALPRLSKYLEQHELSTETREPIQINLLDSSTLNVNLFDEGAYSGCLTIDYRHRRHRGSDDLLAEHLARMIELALCRYTASVMNERSVLRQVLQDAIDGGQIDPEARWVIGAAPDGREYVCVKLVFSSRLAQLPIGYMCNVLEKTFPGSVAFEHDGSIVCFVETGSLGEKAESRLETLRVKITQLVSATSFDVGVSKPFGDIYSAQLYHLQACSALENGKLFAPGAHFHLFSDYALTELITNAPGRLPIELYYTDGLQRLFRHDANSQVSYIQTLRTYLDNNMSITKTTASLYINKSTLLERISRIKRELGVDLHDADERLLLRILLKAMQIQADMHERAGQ